MKWDWFVTLSYGEGLMAVGVTDDRVRADVATWLVALRAVQPKAYAAVCVERGRALGGWHAHVLVGGTGTHPAWPARLRGWWGGHGFHCVRYDPRREPVEGPVTSGACAYLVSVEEGAGVSSGAGVEIVGRMRKPRCRPPRHRQAE